MTNSRTSNPLLKALDKDPSRAEELYRDLSHRLRRYFEWNGFSNGDDLSQETLARGLQRVAEGVEIYSQDPASFFLGIARNVAREGRKTRHLESLSSEHEELAAPASPFRGLNAAESRVLLVECLNYLPHEDRSLLLSYLEGDPAPAGVSPNAYRIRVHRIRKNLEQLCNQALNK